MRAELGKPVTLGKRLRTRVARRLRAAAAFIEQATDLLRDAAFTDGGLAARVEALMIARRLIDGVPGLAERLHGGAPNDVALARRWLLNSAVAREAVNAILRDAAAKGQLDGEALRDRLDALPDADEAKLDRQTAEELGRLVGPDPLEEQDRERAAYRLEMLADFLEETEERLEQAEFMHQELVDEMATLPDAALEAGRFREAALGVASRKPSAGAIERARDALLRGALDREQVARILRLAETYEDELIDEDVWLWVQGLPDLALEAARDREAADDLGPGGPAIVDARAAAPTMQDIIAHDVGALAGLGFTVVSPGSKPGGAAWARKVSERALLAAQRARVEAFAEAARAVGDAKMLTLAEAALRDGPETFDSIIHWASGRRADRWEYEHRYEGMPFARIPLQRAKWYVVLDTDHSRRWTAGMVGVGTPVVYDARAAKPDKYDLEIYFGERPVTDPDEEAPWHRDLQSVPETFYAFAEAVVPFTEDMLPGPGEEPAYDLFEVDLDISARRRGRPEWEQIGWVRAPNKDRAVEFARERWDTGAYRHVVRDRAARMQGFPKAPKGVLRVRRGWQ